MPTPSFKFTSKRLESLTPPPINTKDGRPVVQQRYYWQGDGLGLCVSSTGARSWCFVYRIFERGKRRMRRDVLGAYTPIERSDSGFLTLRQANEKAEQYRRCLERGLDPRQLDRQRATDQRASDANTFLACAERFVKLYRPKKKPHLKPRTLEEYRRHLWIDFKMLHDQPLATITKKDVNRALDMIQERIEGVGSNRCLATARKMFNWAMERGEIDVPPTAGIRPRVPELIRTRHLYGSTDRNQPCEIPLFWAACDAIGAGGAFPKLLLLTGQRRNEVAKMTWGELIDLDGTYPRWIVPEDRSKNWKENIVPLSPPAVEIIRSLPRVLGCPYVLTSDGKTPRSGFSDLKEALDRAARDIREKDAGCYRGQLEQPWVFHDLRRTAKTGMASIGIPGEIRDAIFNHSPAQRMDQVYVHADYSDEKREALTRWGSRLAQILAAETVPENVIPITRRGR